MTKTRSPLNDSAPCQFAPSISRPFLASGVRSIQTYPAWKILSVSSLQALACQLAFSRASMYSKIGCFSVPDPNQYVLFA